MKNYTSKKMPLKQYTYILGLTVRKNIKQQYRNSALGVIWTVLNPLLNMAVMAFVFTTIFNRGQIGMDYPCYILSGNIIFGLMRTATTSSMTCIVGNRDLMTKTKVPTTTFPLSKTVTALSTFGFSMIALLCVMLFQRFVNPSAGLVVFDFSMLIGLLSVPALFLFSLGLSFILSALYVKFRDIQHIYSVLLTLWMYATPLFYSLNTISDPTVVRVLTLNPMTSFVEFFRNVFVGGISPDWIQLSVCYGWGIIIFLLGLFIFQVSKRNFVVNM